MEERIKAIFFNETLRRWHFEDILRKLNISRERANFYLKKLAKDKFVFRFKEKGKMPYYIANRQSEKFRSQKRMYGLRKLEESGLFEELNSDKDIKTAIIFGSLSRGDWNKSSDIDLFIYGNGKNLEINKFEKLTKKEIQIFEYNNPKKIKKDLDPRLIPNIIKGFNVKGNLEPFEVKINA